jgi:hypothetical protein
LTIRSIVDRVACEPLRGAGDRPSELADRLVFGSWSVGGLSKPAAGVGRRVTAF